jgi:pimeloyl-ACP methyl ester carboxylesterase
MTQPRDYDRLVRLIASRGIEVVAPVGHRRDLHALRGLRTVDDEAHDVERVVTAIDPSVVAGHSRGALVAWIVAGARPDGGVIAVDPVIGDVRRGPAARFDPRRAPGHVLVVGAERPGRCAPTGFDDRTVAAATPPNHRFPTMPGTHAILPMGHADLLDPFARFVGGLLCGGNTDPALVRATVAALIGSAALGHPSVDAVGGHLPTVEWIVARA